MNTELKNKNILLIISGGIAAYKSLELIRLFKKQGASVRCILTKGGEQFVTPLSVAALSENEVHTDLWSLKDETEMRHIRLTREADIIIIAPASADIMAKLANGIADTLVTTTLLAADNKPTFIAPAMNHQMWNHPATKANLEKLKNYGYHIIPPTEGDMACGEHGVGRLEEPENIIEEIKKKLLNQDHNPLSGYKALVTAGPTYEPLDPVRFIGNRSSGKQGYAIATALSAAGADVTLISGPTALPDPTGINILRIETAQEMLKACENALPADIAICAAAVSDWTPKNQHAQKIKKTTKGDIPELELEENPDILKTLSYHSNRPSLVIGFAAETENLNDNAQSKLERKGCDIILANLVHTDEGSIFGSDQNHIYLIDKKTPQDWGKMSKQAIAEKLTTLITQRLNIQSTS